MHHQYKCFVCHQPITTSFFPTYWGNVCKACYKPHLQCFSCNKQLAEKTALRLSDYRLICSNCFADAFFTFDQSSIKLILKILSQWGIFIQQPITYEIVDLNVLLNLKKQNGIISTTIAGQCYTQYQISPAGKKTISGHKIFILFGLPKEQFMAYVVHELFHAWLHENNPFNLTFEDHEFLCELISYHFAKTLHFDATWFHYRFELFLNHYRSPLSPTLLKLPPEKIIQGFLAPS